MGDRRPVIGIGAALETASYGFWEKPSALIQMNYIEAIQRAGGMALLIPYDPALITAPDEILERLDALVLAGGSDLDPTMYGAVLSEHTADAAPERDALEIALVNRAIERQLPLLGICRGMQVLNVARGGTLVQHLPDVVGHGEHRRNPGTFEGNDHEVTLEPGSLAARAAGEQTTTVKSHHHQGIERLGDGLVITGHSALDGFPEAIELLDADYVLGVQWHPEADEASRVIGSLVEFARTSAADPVV